jgi:methionyl-tRNA formyltransferase
MRHDASAWRAPVRRPALPGGFDLERCNPLIAASQPMPDPLRIVFMGTAELACASLRALLREPAFHVAAAVTQPDKPRGRDLRLQPPPVKQAALAAGLPVLQPLRARDPAFLQELAAWRPELIVVAAYGQILPQAILDLPPHGCLNVHTSLLPKYRGAAPIQWALLNGDAETGVTIMRMDAGLDTGPTLARATTPIAPEDNAQTLHDRLAALGAELLVKTIPGYVSGQLQPQPQPAEGACYARKIEKEDGRIDWQQPAPALWNRVRAFTPWPGAHTTLGAGGARRLLKIWSAEAAPGARDATPGTVLQAGKDGILVACGEGALRIRELQREGGRRMSTVEFLTGHALPEGERLGQ